MATAKRERISSSSGEDTDVIESDGIENIGVIRRPKRKVKKTKKKAKSISPSNTPAAGSSKSSGDASGSAEKPPKEDNNEDDRCPICLCEFGPEVAFPDSCEHKFCSGCILEWAKKVNTCPIDRSEFKYVLILNRDSSEPCERIEISKRFPKVPLGYPNPATACIICGLEENLMTCCECYRGFHSSCLFLTLSNDPVQDWRCPYCVFREAHDGLSPLEYASPSQLRTRQYERAQEYLQRLTRMYRTRVQQPIAVPPSPPHPPPSVQLSEPFRPPTAMADARIEIPAFDLLSSESSGDESDEAIHEADSILSFFRNAVQLLEAPAPSPSTTSVSSTSITSEDSSSEVEEYNPTGSSGSMLNPIHVSSDSSDDEISSLHASNDLNEELSTSQQLRQHMEANSNGSTDAPSVRNLPAASRLRLSPENDPEIFPNIRVIRGPCPNSNAVHSGQGSSSSHLTNDPIENPSRNYHENSLPTVPYLYCEGHTMTRIRNLMLESRRSTANFPSCPLLPPQDDFEILENTRVLEEGSHRNSTAMHSGHGSNNSRCPNSPPENPYGSLRERQSAVSNISAGGDSQLMFRMNLMREYTELNSIIQRVPPPQNYPEILDTTRVVEEGSHRNSTAMHSGHGSNNSHCPNGLAENPYGSLHESRRSAVSNISAGGNANLASTIQQLPPPVNRTALSENSIALLSNSPSVVTRSCISHTNWINAMPENSSSSIQRSPARPTTRHPLIQPLILAKPHSSNSSTTYGS